MNSNIENCPVPNIHIRSLTASQQPHAYDLLVEQVCPSFASCVEKTLSQRLCHGYSADRKTLTSMFIRSMERLDKSGQIAKPTQDRAWWPLRHDESGAAFEESQPNRWSSASSSSSPSSASTQLSGAGCEKRTRSPAAADAE